MRLFNSLGILKLVATAGMVRTRCGLVVKLYYRLAWPSIGQSFELSALAAARPQLSGVNG
jgi:hypothetical protein